MTFAPNASGNVADKVFELFAAWDCYIADIHIDASGALLMGCSYDMGGVRNTWERIVEAGSTSATNGANNGIALEGNRDSRIVQCSTRDNKFCGFGLGACTSCLVEEGTSDNDVYGVYLGALAGDNTGCTFCIIRDVIVRNSQSAAVGIGFGSSYNIFDGIAADNCLAGVVCGALGGAASHHNLVRNCIVRGGNNGLAAIDGSHDNSFIGCLTAAQGGVGLYLNSGPATVIGCRVESAQTSMMQVGDGVNVNCQGLELLYTGEALGNHAIYMVSSTSVLRGRGIRFVATANKPSGTLVVFNQYSAGGTVDVNDVDLTFYDNTSTVYPVYIQYGRFNCRNYRQVNGTYAFVLHGTGGRVWIEGVLDVNNLGSSGALVALESGATADQCNVGQFTATGSSTTVTIPQIRSKSVLRLWIAGAIEVPVDYSIDPNTKAVTFSPLTTGTIYYWQLIS